MTIERTAKEWAALNRIVRDCEVVGVPELTTVIRSMAGIVVGDGFYDLAKLALIVANRAQSKSAQESPKAESVTANSILSAGAGHLKERGVTYDAPGGERSMGKTLQIFGIYSGLHLTEEQGWAFMEILKLVRSSQGEYKADNYEDGAAYFALMGEAAFNANQLSNAVGVIHEKAKLGEPLLSPVK